MEDVRNAVVATTSDLHEGSLGERQAFQIGSNDQLFVADAYLNAVIACAATPVLLRDIGTAVDGVENAELAGWCATPARAATARRRSSWISSASRANIIDVCDSIKALLPKLRSSCCRRP